MRPYGIGVDAIGRVLVSNGGPNHDSEGSLRRILPELPLFDSDNPTDFRIAATGGREVYVFNSEGRHEKTEDALTGAARTLFKYDGQGRLIHIVEKVDLSETWDDTKDRVTDITWQNGVPTAVVAPFAQQTTLTSNGSGWVDDIENPEQELWDFTIRADGLLDSLIDPRGGPHDYDYDDRGRLDFDKDPAGGETTLVRTEGDNLLQVEHQTLLGRNTLYEVDGFIYGPRTHRTTELTTPNHITTERVETLEGMQTVNYPWATEKSWTAGWDPRFGLESQFPVEVTVAVENGPAGTASLTRTTDLSDPDDPYSFTQITDSMVVNGRPPATSVYDKASRTRTVTSSEDPGRQLIRTLDLLGRIKTIDLPGMEPFVFGYDPRGRIETITQKDRTITNVYNAEGVPR